MQINYTAGKEYHPFSKLVSKDVESPPVFFLMSKGTSGLIKPYRSWEAEIAEKLWRAMWEAGWPLP